MCGGASQVKSKPVVVANDAEAVKAVNAAGSQKVVVGSGDEVVVERRDGVAPSPTKHLVNILQIFNILQIWTGFISDTV